MNNDHLQEIRKLLKTPIKFTDGRSLYIRWSTFGANKITIHAVNEEEFNRNDKNKRGTLLTFNIEAFQHFIETGINLLEIFEKLSLVSLIQ